MCHRRQNSIIEVALYGEEKLIGNRMPKSNAKPIAISEYPEKSKYIWTAKNTAASQAVNVESISPLLAAEKIGSLK